METLPVNDTLWNHKLIRVFWLILLIYEMAAMIGFVVVLFTAPSSWAYELLRFQVLPGSIHVLVMWTGYRFYNKMRKQRDYVMVSWCTAIATIYLLTIPELYTRYEVLCLPIFLSSIFFERKKVAYAYILCFTVSLLLFGLNLLRIEGHTVYEILVSMSVITAAALICRLVMGKGWYLFDRLSDSMEREKDLMVRHMIAEQVAKIDALTGLYNHRSFQEQTHDIVSSYSPGSLFEMVLMDIDNFKSVNDTYGHWVGDQVLKTISATLKDHLDSLYPAFRYGGEEFAVLIAGKTHEEALTLCQELLQSIRTVTIPEMDGRGITLSVGLASLESGMSKDQWFKTADQRLYAAKKNGKNQVVSRDANLLTY